MLCCCAAGEDTKGAETITTTAAEPVIKESAPAQEEKAEPKQEEAAEVVSSNEFVFVMSDGGEKKVVFQKSPLGLTFHANKVPVVIKKLASGGHAEELGVQTGMQIKTIGGKDLTDMSYDQIFKMIEGVSKALKQDP
mmetsp:Transcript_29856/g.75135  ORF Transcript_29856/g.75135 Transcript_29856/m.75135 type:complete len:137 (+) Transcript_29856:78-488(+)